MSEEPVIDPATGEEIPVEPTKSEVGAEMGTGQEIPVMAKPRRVKHDTNAYIPGQRRFSVEGEENTRFIVHHNADGTARVELVQNDIAMDDKVVKSSEVRKAMKELLEESGIINVEIVEEHNIHGPKTKGRKELENL